VDISTEIIDRIFAGAKDCQRIVLTGGEPLLCLDMIEYLVDKIEEYQWQTKCLELTTNGIIQDARIIKLMSRFCGFKEENQAYLRVSTDEFHDVVASAKGLSFYWELCKALPNIMVFPSGELPAIFLRGRAKELIKTQPALAERYLMNEHDCSLNHRIEIADGKVRDKICVHANGNVGLAGQISYDDADMDAFGNILNQRLTELVDSHNNKCLITCAELKEYNATKEWSWRNVERIFEHQDIIPDKIRYRLIQKIFDLTLALRQKARKLYPYVPAQDIIDMLPVAFVRENVASTIPMLSGFQIERCLDSMVLEEINEFFLSSTWENKESIRRGLLSIAYLTQEMDKLPPDPDWTNQPLQKLSALNEQYRLGQRCWRNDKNFLCDDDRAGE